MNIKPLILALLLNCTVFYLKVSGQIIDTSVRVSAADSSIGSNNNLLTIAYNIQVKTDREKTGIEETYNGGIKTIFIDNDKARVRLVSLMRIQSIFFSSSKKYNHAVAIVKESGKRKYKYYLTDEQWELYNNKYNNDSCQFTNDSAVILNYPCRKAIVMLQGGRSLTVYYTNQLKAISHKIEPEFSCIPGLVLQYEYDYKKGTLIYTASKISENPVTSGVFKIPRGIALKKYCSRCRGQGKEFFRKFND